MSKRILAPAFVAAFALVAGPATAQNPTPPPKAGSLQVQIAPAAGAQMAQSNEDNLKRDLAAAKKKIAELTKSLEDCQKVRDTAQAKANVRMFCADNVTSKNSLGATENCSPYVCSAVSGLCVKRCGTTADCAGGFACDTQRGICMSTR